MIKIRVYVMLSFGCNKVSTCDAKSPNLIETVKEKTLLIHKTINDEHRTIPQYEIMQIESSHLSDKGLNLSLFYIQLWLS